MQNKGFTGGLTFMVPTLMIMIMILAIKDAKATKSAAERGIYWLTDIYDPHTGQVATQLGPSFSPMMKIIYHFLAMLVALDFTLVSK